MSNPVDRLLKYNGDPYKAGSNPYGLDGADGGISGLEKNLPQALNDIGAMASSVTVLVSAQSTVSMQWDAGTASANPGAGKARATTATPAAGSYSLILSTTDADGGDVTAMLAELGASTSAMKARARLVNAAVTSQYVDLAVTGVTIAVGYRVVAVTAIGGPAGFAVGARVALGWVRTGDKGEAGGGDVAANPNTLVQRDGAAAISSAGLKAPGGASDSFALTMGIAEQTSDGNWNFPQQGIRRRQSNAASVKMQAFLLGGDNIADTAMGAYWASWLICSAPPAAASTSAIVTKCVLSGPGDLDLRPSSGRLLLNGVSIASLISSVTFNAADKSANVTLSAGNKAAQGSGVGIVRGMPAIPSGKWVFGFRIDALASAGGAGIATGAAIQTGYLGQDANGWAYDTLGNKVSAGAVTAMGPVLAVGDILYVYVNTTTGKVWFARNGVLLASGDPAGDSNPAFSGLVGPLYVACGPGNGTQMTLLVSAAELPYPPVSGFGTLP